MPCSVLLKIPSPLHGSYETIARNPPDGFEYHREVYESWESSDRLHRGASNLLYDHPRIRDALLLTRERLRSSLRHGSRFSLVLSLMPFTGFNKVPTILFTEASELGSEVSTDSRIRRTMLLKSGVKKILAPGPTAATTYLSVLSNKEFEEKVDVLTIGVPLPPDLHKMEKETTDLLFISSAHEWEQFTYEHRSFFTRGGVDVLSAFRIISKRFGNGVRLIIRSNVPEPVKRLYADVLRLPNVVLIENVLPRKELQNIYKRSDILLFPGYHGAGLTLPEAFSYSVPAVVSDSWDTADDVIHRVNGLVVHRENGSKLRVVNHIPHWDRHAIAHEPPDNFFVKSYAEAVSKLIEDKVTRKSLARNARQMVESGQFSLGNMKRKLAEVFAEALS